jgi:hypothetical protein
MPQGTTVTVSQSTNSAERSAHGGHQAAPRPVRIGAVVAPQQVLGEGRQVVVHGGARHLLDVASVGVVQCPRRGR